MYYRLNCSHPQLGGLRKVHVLLSPLATVGIHPSAVVGWMRIVGFLSILCMQEGCQGFLVFHRFRALWSQIFFRQTCIALPNRPSRLVWTFFLQSHWSSLRLAAVRVVPLQNGVEESHQAQREGLPDLFVRFLVKGQERLVASIDLTLRPILCLLPSHRVFLD